MRARRKIQDVFGGSLCRVLSWITQPPLHSRDFRLVWEELRPPEFLLSAADEKQVVPDTILLFWQEKEWQFPLVGNAPSPSPKWLLLGMVCIGVYSIHAQLINQCQMAIVIQKQVLSVDNNGRNTEICHRSGSVSHADTRGSLRRVS